MCLIWATLGTCRGTIMTKALLSTLLCAQFHGERTLLATQTSPQEAGNCLYTIHRNGNVLPGIIISASCQPELPFHCKSRWASKPTNSQKCSGKEGGGRENSPASAHHHPPPHPSENLFLNESWGSPVCKGLHCTRGAETPQDIITQKFYISVSPTYLPHLGPN